MSGALTERSVEAVRAALAAVVPELADLPIVLDDMWTDAGNPLWARSSAFVGDAWVVKFAWTPPAADRLFREGRVSQALGRARSDVPVRRVERLTEDPVLLVSPFVPGHPVTGDEIARAAPGEVQRLGAMLAAVLAAFHDPAAQAAIEAADLRLPIPSPQAGTSELRERLVPRLDPRRRALVDVWCVFTDDVLSIAAESVVLHGDFHGYNVVVDDRQHVRVVLDLEEASYGDYHYDFRYLPAQAPTLDLFRAAVAEYERLTARVIDLRRVMAWHVRTVLGDALWRTAAGVPLPGGGTTEQWIDELAGRFEQLGLDGSSPTAARTDRARTTARLRLEPIQPRHADDLWSLHQDPGVGEWYDGAWTRGMIDRYVARSADAWAVDGVHKWMAYDATSGELVGRGGLSRAFVDGARRLEVGWIVRSPMWGQGYATEIGRAALAMAFEELGADEVVAFTEPHNRRSRAVMERLGMSGARAIVHDGAPFVLYTIASRERGTLDS
jgi:ribosomal-protein-alanine N-acetyltransferase